ncbi:MAG TPA: NAD(P)-dependent alcohol dehydrogenase [Parachlamydiaceae bacterium]|nr:NAD(P)-dependent alcohol dehydrogenase [Parachlamydiaceae bacterium]
MSKIEAWVASSPKSKLVRQEIDLGRLQEEEVEVAVEYCGICHSDLSVLNNEWGNAKYPAVLGHEIAGRIVAIGSAAKGVKVGQKVGIGWTCSSCMHCRQCMSGNHNFCPGSTATIIGHNGGFSSHVRAHWAYAIPIPEKLPLAEVGPLLCGGITVFNPLVTYVKPTDRVAVVGIGGLGHLAVKFAAAFGCEVTAFTSSESKFQEARDFGAQNVVSSKDLAAIQKLKGKFDLILVTVNVPLDWGAYIAALAPKGRLHFVGVVKEDIPIQIFPLLVDQLSISSSPIGPPAAISDMLDFASRHHIVPKTEHFAMSQINKAFEHLEAGKARYRIVLDADF